MIILKWFTPIFLVVAGCAIIMIAIQSGFDGSDSVTGYVVNIESPTLTTFSELVIEDRSGTIWTFMSNGYFSGFTPSHLEEHRALRQPVTVSFTKLENGQNRIVSISD